jgi:hypothetical protein
MATAPTAGTVLGGSFCISPSKGLVSDRMTVHVSYFLSEFSSDTSWHKDGYLFDKFKHLFAQLVSRANPTGDDAEPLSINPTLCAAEALVQGHFGRAVGDRGLMTESLLTYGRALRSLSAKLAHVRRVGFRVVSDEDWEDTAFACLTLAFWEVCK